MSDIKLLSDQLRAVSSLQKALTTKMDAHGLCMPSVYSKYAGEQRKDAKDRPFFGVSLPKSLAAMAEDLKKGSKSDSKKVKLAEKHVKLVVRVDTMAASIAAKLAKAKAAAEKKPKAVKPAAEKKTKAVKPAGEKKPKAAKPAAEKKPKAAKPAAEKKPKAAKPAAEKKPKAVKPAAEKKPRKPRAKKVQAEAEAASFWGGYDAMSESEFSDFSDF